MRLQDDVVVAELREVVGDRRPRRRPPPDDHGTRRPSGWLRAATPGLLDPTRGKRGSVRGLVQAVEVL